MFLSANNGDFAKAFRLTVVNKGISHVIEMPPFKLTFPLVDMFEDGRVLLAETRAQWRNAEDYDKNGFIFDPVSRSLSNFLLGDGIEALGVDSEDRIWVSYFDEGVFGNLGWSTPGPHGPGSGGLVCFGEDGNILWQFNGNDSADFIDDCYALNVTRNEVWAYYYSDFKLCRVDGCFSPHIFDAVSVSGASAFAVSDAGLVFNRQYGEDPDCFHILQRSNDRIGQSSRINASYADGRPLDTSVIFGRGSFLHTIGPKGWFRADINEVF